MSLSTVDISSTYPYPGLRPFEPYEADIFFGRKQHVTDLLKRLRSQRFLAVVGPSGCGKSSLIRAGLIPALQAGFMSSSRFQWNFAVMRPGNQPVLNLANALRDSGIFGDPNLDDVQSATELHMDLESGSRRLADRLTVNERAQGANLLILVDQFEELFRFERSGGADESRAFVNMLLETVRDPNISTYVVITMRTDFLGHCPVLSGLPEAINASQYLTPRLSREQIEAAIVGPARMFHGEVHPDVVNRILNEMGTDPDQLPLMQHLLMRMWRSAYAQLGIHKSTKGPGSVEEKISNFDISLVSVPPSDSLQLTMSHYADAGGLQEALSQHAERVYTQRLISDNQRRLAEGMFRKLTNVASDGQLIRRSPAPTLEELNHKLSKDDQRELRSVINEFRTDGRSFLMPPMVEPLVAETPIDISHESLIRRWPRLEAWTRDQARASEVKREATKDAVQWEAGGKKPEDSVIPESRLVAALAWAEAHPDHVTALVKDFLAASVRQRDDQRGKEVALEWARKKMLAIAVFAMVFMGTTLTAIIQWKKADTAQRDLKVQQAKTQSSLADQYWFHAADELQGFQADDKTQGQEKSDVYKGLMWLAEAYEVAQSKADQLPPEVQRLYEVRAGAILSQHPMPDHVAYFSGKRSVAISRDEKFVIVISEPRSAELEIHALSAESQEHLHKLPTGWPVRSAVFSPDGNHLLAIKSFSGNQQRQENQNQLTIWSWPEGDRKNVPRKVSTASLVSEGSMTGAEFLLDTKGQTGLIATILDSKGATGVWVWETLDAPGRRLVINEQSPESTAPQKAEPAGPLFAAQFKMSPDGRFAVIQDSVGRNVSLLDADSLRLIPAPELKDMVASVIALSDDGEWLAIAGEGGGVFPRKSSRAYESKESEVSDGKKSGVLIFSTSRIKAGKFTQVAEKEGLPGITKIAFGPNRQVVTVADGNKATLWTFEAPRDEGSEQLRRGASVSPSESSYLQQHRGEIYLNGEVNAVKFSRNGRLLAIGCRDRLMRVIDVHSGRLALPPLHHPLGISEVSYSSDGRFVTGRTEYAVLRWNLAARNAPAKIICRDLAEAAVTSSNNHRFVATIQRNPNQIGGENTTDYVVSVIDLSGEREKQLQPVDSNRWKCLNVSDDGRSVLLTDNYTFQLVRFANGDSGIVTDLAGISADSTVAAELPPLVETSMMPVNIDARAAFSPDSRFLLIASGAASIGLSLSDAVPSWKLQLWDVDTAKPTLENPAQIEFSPVNQVAWSPTNDSFVLAVGGNTSGSGQLWRLGDDHKPELSKQLEHPDEIPENLKIVSAAFSSDGQYVVTGGVGDKAYVWRSGDGERVSGALQHDSDVNMVQFIGDPKAKLLLATAGTADKKVNIWKIDRNDGSSFKKNVDPLFTVNPQAKIESLIVSTDNEWLATVSGSDVWLWSLHQGQLAAVLKHSSSVKSVRFSDDSRSLRTVRVNAGTTMEFRPDKFVDGPLRILLIESEWQLRSSLTGEGPTQLREIGQLLAASELNLQDRGLIRLTKMDESFNDTPDSATARNLEKLWTKYGRRLSESLPPSFEADSVAADRFEATGEWFAAAWHYQNAIDDLPTDNSTQLAELYAGLGRVYTQRKEFGKARTAWDLAVEKDQKWQAAADLFHIAQARDAATRFEVQKDWEKAAEEWTTVIKLSSDTDSAPIYQRSKVYLQMERWQDSEIDFRRAIELESIYYRPFRWKDRAATLASAKQWPAAAVALKEAFQISPTADNGYALAVAQLKAGEKTAYAETCKDLLFKFADCGNTNDANNAAWAMALSGEILDKELRKMARDGAQSSAEQSEDSHQKYLSLNTFGATCFRNGEYELARETLHKARQVYVDGAQDAQVGSANEVRALTDQDGTVWDWVFLSMTCHQLGDKEAARKWFLQADKWVHDGGVLSWLQTAELEILLEESRTLVMPDNQTSRSEL